LRAAEARSQVHVHHTYEAQAARELAVAAGELPDPSLRMSLDNLTVDGPARWSLAREPMTMGSIGLMQTFTRGDKRAARAGRYEQQARVADSEAIVLLTNLRRDTALAWLERYYREQMLLLLQQQRSEVVILVATTEAAYAAGTNLQVDVFMARTELALIDDRIREATTLHANAITALSRWVGPNAGDPLGAAPAITSTSLQSAAIESAVLQQPELQALTQQEALAQSEVKLAQLNKRDDWSAEFMFSRRDPDFGNMVSLGVSIPLQLGRVNKQDRELSAKLAMVEGVRSQRTELQRQYLAQVKTWIDSWRSNLERMESYDTAIMPLAQERSQAALSAYRGGSMPLAAVLDARRAEIQTQLDRLRIEMETAALWAQLEFLLPRDTGASARQTQPQEN
jgi:outer membrane protein TolC